MNPVPPRHRSRPRTVLAAVLPALLLALAACAPPRKTAQVAAPAPVVLAAAPGGYLGNDACADCHAKEVEEHRHTRHAQTLRFVDPESLGTQAPEPGPIPDSNYQLFAVGGQFVYGPSPDRTLPLHLAFGSGKSGIAFASVLPGDALAEARMSYLPALKKWFVTPGQQKLSDTTPGNVMRGTAARQCVGCHTVTLPKDALMPERRFLGVGCESCHGPGETHVRAVQKGDVAHLQMVKFGSQGGKQINALCGRCHRTDRDVIDKHLAREKTDLFQAYGLSKSRCFRESGDRLSCLSCHGPHADARTDDGAYTAACLSCHAGARSPAPAATNKACPVSPTERCVSCHMPKRPEPLFDGSPRRIADHFIRIYRATAQKKL
jgi:hypothetical protein